MWKGMVHWMKKRIMELTQAKKTIMQPQPMGIVKVSFIPNKALFANSMLPASSAQMRGSSCM